MIERVAIALFAVNGIAEDWLRYSEKTREGYRAYARAAIEELRYVPLELIPIGERAYTLGDPNVEFYSTGFEDAWRAIFDAILDGSESDA